jgi:nicotinamidase-related amidase
LDVEKIGRTVRKGMHKGVEMYSAFYDPLRKRVCDSGLSEVLRGEGVVKELEEAGVRVVGLEGEEVGWVRGLSE